MATTLSVQSGGLYGLSLYGASLYGTGGFVDYTAYLLHDSLTVKVNTLDFTLDNPPAYAVQLGDGVKLTDPTWAGTVASVMTSDPVDLRNGIEFLTVTATNSDALVATTGPFDLSDVPTVT